MMASLAAEGISNPIVVRRDGQVEPAGARIVDVTGPGNMVHCLMSAREELLRTSCDVLVCYSDIVIEQVLMHEIVRSDVRHERCEVVIDTEWERYYRYRFNGGIGDAESLTLSGRRILDIGRTLSESAELPDGQFVGLVRFAASTFRFLVGLWAEMNDPNLYTTDVLRELSRRGVPIDAIPVAGGWLEIDTISDYEMAKSLLSGADRVPFFRRRLV
jgi:L-glutamine-phosphate cytidylyltransferase